MKIIKIITIIFFSIAVISNLPFVAKPLLGKLDASHFKYSNLNASFTYVQSFGFKDSYIGERTKYRFKTEAHPTPENETIYRLYKINPLCFWRWHYYIFISSKFPYKRWDEIEKNRVAYDRNNMWQDF